MATPRAINTPGPHLLQAKPSRQEDVQLQQRIEQQALQETNIAHHESPTSSLPDPNQHLVDVFRQLTKVMKDSNTSDTTDPGQFNGSDEKWDEFYAQLRAYLSAKNWLTTFEHPTGPGSPGFDNEINKKQETLQ
jgi:hypothetical protein